MNIPFQYRSLTLALSLALSGPVWAQAHDHAAPTARKSQAASPTPAPAPAQKNSEPSQVDQSNMDHSQMSSSQMDHSKMDHSQMSGSQMDHSKMDHSQMSGSQMDHSKMDHSQMTGNSQPASSAPAGNIAPATLTPREPIPAVTEADRAAAFPPLKPHAMEHPSRFNSFVLLDRLEAWDTSNGTGTSQAWEASAWFGTDLNRMWLRSSGEREGSHTESSDLEVLYGRSISPWWDVVVGVKQDFRPANSRTWGALGIQGLAPYKYEFSATAYLGESGQVVVNMEAEYDVLLTNRLILQPAVEASFSSKNVRQYGESSGLNKVEAGLRLRYEITRRFAPYIGLVHERSLGQSADYQREEGGRTRDTRFIAGIRIWF